MSKKILVSITLLALVIVGACSILKKEDPEKEVRTFLQTFQESLAGSEEDVLKQFEVSQSRQSIQTAISILQNKANPNIVCEANFSAAVITPEDDTYKVEIPVMFRSVKLEEEYSKESTLTIFVKSKGNDGLVISKLEGDVFYQTFAFVKNQMQWSVERQQALIERDTVYSLAKRLEQKFDSVIWYTQYDGHTLFYIAQGEWINYFRNWEPKPKGASNHKMGLIDSRGEIIIPVEYDLIGTIGYSLPMIVEVKKDNKVGLFNIEKRAQIIPTIHDLIIPSDEENVFCVVKTDTTYGWYSNDMKYQDGFPSTAVEKWVKNFEYIPAHIQFDETTVSLCEIPRAEDAGFGFLMPPSFMVRTGIFNEIIGGISTTEVPLNGWTDYVETEGTFLKTVTSSINALVTTIRERYIDGREEFYTHDKLVFVNNKQDTLGVSDLSAGGDIIIKRRGDDLIEIQYEPASEYYYEYEAVVEEMMPMYRYFRIADGVNVESLSSNRTFEYTEFVKIDSSFLSGDFKFWNSESSSMEKRDFLSVPTLKYMRDEILASYHYRFPDPETLEKFKQYDWYKDEYDSRDQFMDDMTEIDRYNIEYLEKLIEQSEAHAI